MTEATEKIDLGLVRRITTEIMGKKKESVSEKKRNGTENKSVETETETETEKEKERRKKRKRKLRKLVINRLELQIAKMKLLQLR